MIIDYKIALLIPTMNRQEFIKRQLMFYESSQAEVVVYIGDSSSRDKIEDLKRFIQKLRIVRVKYFHLPHLNGPHTLAFLSEQVIEPFCAFIGDDDLQIPRTLKKCMTFLEKNADYAMAHGKAMIFSYNSTHQLYGDFDSLDYYKQESIEDENATERIKNLLHNYYVTLFSLYRTSVFRKAHTPVKNIKDIAFTEIISCSISVLEGKAFALDDIQFLRQNHSNRLKLPDKTWNKSVNYTQSYNIFIEETSSILAKNSSMSEQNAKNYMKDCFNFYYTMGGRSCENKGNILSKMKLCIRKYVPRKLQKRILYFKFRSIMNLQEMITVLDFLKKDVCHE